MKDIEDRGFKQRACNILQPLFFVGPSGGVIICGGLKANGPIFHPYRWGLEKAPVYISSSPLPHSEEKHFHKSASRYMCSQFPGSGH